MTRFAVVMSGAALVTTLSIISSASCQVFPPGLQLIAVGGKTGGQNIADVDVVTVTSNAHAAGAPLPMNLSNFGSTMVNNIIYIVGGDSSKDFQSFFAYNVTANIWTKLPDLPFNILANAVVAVGNAIYSLGGYAPYHSFARHTYKYDLNERVWSKLPALLPAITISPCAVADSTNIYHLNRDDLYRTSDGANTWTKLSSTNSNREYAACALLPKSGQILVAGGSTASTAHNGTINSTELYDIATDTWKKAAPMNRARDMARVAVVPGSDDVVICGGEDDNEHVTYDDCELYSVAKNQWNVLNFTLNVPRSSYGLFVTQV